MIVRENQREVLNAAAANNYKVQLLAHVSRFFPRLHSVLGESDTQLLVEHGMRRANHYGFRTRKEVCRYVDLTVALGPRFDVDATLPWAQLILRDSKLDNAAKLNNLFEAADLVLRRIAEVGSAKGGV